MISELATDLNTAVKSIASGGFGTAPVRVGLAVGAKAVDPTMQKVPTPAAWIVFTGDTNLSTEEQGECFTSTKMEFIVKVFLEYDTELDLITNQYPVLNEVITTVNGRQGPNGSKRWKYEGQTLDELTGNRVVFDQRYSIIASL